MSFQIRYAVLLYTRVPGMYSDHLCRLLDSVKLLIQAPGFYWNNGMNDESPRLFFTRLLMEIPLVLKHCQLSTLNVRYFKYETQQTK